MQDHKQHRDNKRYNSVQQLNHKHQYSSDPNKPTS